MTTDTIILRRAIARLAVERVNPDAYYPVVNSQTPDGSKADSP